jgi:hypothetical protein
VRFLAYWTLRQEQICSSPAICPDSEDGETHGPECDVTRIEELLGGSAVGALLFRAEEIDFALKAGFHVGLGDITAEEFTALQVLQLERDRWQLERDRNHGSQQIQD